MANVIIPVSDMLTRRQVDDPRTTWAMLGSNKWRYDFGLMRHLAQFHSQHIADHIFSQTRNKPLWDLITSTDADVATTIATHYQFAHAGHFQQFIRFVYNHVAPDLKWEGDEPMNHFPYHTLHTYWVANILCPVLEKTNP